MKPWHLIVTGLYALVLAALALPLFFVGASLPPNLELLGTTYLNWPTWLWVGAMACCQLVLLAVPVRITQKRPIGRGSLWPTVVVGATMMALLALAAGLVIHAAIMGDHEAAWESAALAAIAVISWAFWAVLFHRLGRRRPPADFLSILCHRLFQGSILELLVAVPCHVVVRHRQDCCAGLFTMFGLGMGASVMLLAFGPALYFLFVARAQRLQSALPPEPR